MVRTVLVLFRVSMQTLDIHFLEHAQLSPYAAGVYL